MRATNSPPTTLGLRSWFRGVRLACAVACLSLSPWAAADDSTDVVAELDVPVVMRDGVTLRANVYRPATGGPYPVLVSRTPYGKGRNFNQFVRAGYIVVSQDARGRYVSDGQFESFERLETHDAEDGYDTIAWAAKLPNSTGKVGTIGTSYNAFLQWRLAASRPPALAAMAAFSIPARYTDLEGPGTIRPGRRLKWWATTASPDLRKRAGLPGTQTQAEALDLWDLNEGAAFLWFVPWLELPDRVFESGQASMNHWLRNPHLDPWKLDLACAEIDVPNLNVCGWYDHCNGSIDLHTALASTGHTEAAREGSRLVVGPWSHVSLGRRKTGGIDFGPAAEVDMIAAQIDWFDQWLKGEPRAKEDMAQVRIYVMGVNEWRDEPKWPLDRATPTTMYLTSGGEANTPAGDGSLVHDAPSAAMTDDYVYDPRDPVPTLYGSATYTIPADQRPLVHRRDILVYQSPPLTEELEVIGYPRVILHAASTAPDTDFFARLVDVAPDGTNRDVVQGMVRARYRHSLERPKLIEPNAVVEYEIELGPTANRFLRGHRVRLDITSSDFPNYDRNHNTAADQNADALLVPATQTIHHGGERASRLILPVIAP